MEEKVVRIERIVFGGKGLSRDLQKVAFVPFTLPTEKVRIRIKREHRDYLEAEPVEIVEPSAARTTPQCPYFGRCGGCQMSHADYESQVRFKTEILLETLKRDHVESPEIQIFTGEPYGYCHRARLKFDPVHGRIGFFKGESHQIVDIQECICLTPGLNRLLKLLRTKLKAKISGLSEIDCYENDRGQTVAFFNAPIPLAIQKDLQAETIVCLPGEAQNPELTFHFRDSKFPVRPDIFLQMNPRLWKIMVQEMESHHPDSRDMIAVELYCGAGFFTLPLSNLFRRIVACEENEAAIRFARRHYSDRNVEWIRTRAEEFSFPADATVGILDPPRAGLHRTVLDRILGHPFKKITYVSCDCSSFARDVRLLKHKYTINRLSLVDLFPQTFHFEIISLLTARNH